MKRRQAQIRVRLRSGEVIDALVLEWLSYPERALVQLPSHRRPSAVTREAATGVYRAPWRPSPTPQLALVLGSALAAVTILAFVVSPTAAPVTPAGSTASTQLPALPTELRDLVGAERAATSQLPLPRNTPAEPQLSGGDAPRPLPSAAPHARTAERRSASTRAARPATVDSASYQVDRAAFRGLPSSRHRVHTCECGRTFDSVSALEAHRKKTVYACIRYPKCKFSSASIEAVVNHYEKDRDHGARCWLEAARLGSRYAVVVRPRCSALASHPTRRKVIKVAGAQPTDDDRGPWR